MKFIEWSNAGIRIPSSGSATQLELPDVLGFVDGVLFACEVKFTSNPYSRFDVQEAVDLIHFSYFWDAVPVFVSRFSQDTTLYGEACLSESEIPSESGAKSFSYHDEKRDEYRVMEELVHNPPPNTTRDVYDEPPKS